MYQCRQGDHQFTHRSSLSRHIKEYCGERHKVDCPSCGKQFNSRGTMTKHLIRCQTGKNVHSQKVHSQKVHSPQQHLVSEVINVDHNHHNVNIINSNNHITNVNNQIYLTRDP